MAPPNRSRRPPTNPPSRTSSATSPIPPASIPASPASLRPCAHERLSGGRAALPAWPRRLPRAPPLRHRPPSLLAAGRPVRRTHRPPRDARPPGPRWYRPENDRRHLRPVHGGAGRNSGSARCPGRDLLGHLGRDGIGLKMIAGIYGLFTAVLAGIQVLLAVPVGTYFATFLGITALMLLMVLLSETSNSLVNPVEGLVLAHQPINGATYTAAKLTHLLRVLAYIVPSLNLLPALAGFLLPGARWTYPLVHFFSACVLGVVIALFCCAFFGNLIRFVPPARLKTVGQIAEAAPLLFLLLAGNLSRVLKTLHVSRALSGHPAALWSLATACGAIVVLSVVFGIRALSGDYLVRVSAIVHGASHAPARRTRRTPLAAAIARLAGGQSARAGFEYVRRMMVRDWLFRRQLIPMIPTALMGLLAIFGGVRTSPFSGTFTPVHFLPHALGALLFVACTALAHG